MHGAGQRAADVVRREAPVRTGGRGVSCRRLLLWAQREALAAAGAWGLFEMYHKGEKGEEEKAARGGEWAEGTGVARRGQCRLY